MLNMWNQCEQTFGQITKMYYNENKKKKKHISYQYCMICIGGKNDLYMINFKINICKKIEHIMKINFFCYKCSI